MSEDLVETQSAADADPGAQVQIRLIRSRRRRRSCPLLQIAAGCAAGDRGAPRRAVGDRFALPRYASQVLRDFKRFSSVNPNLPGTEDFDAFRGVPVMTFVDPPIHTRLRRVAAPFPGGAADERHGAAVSRDLRTHSRSLDRPQRGRRRSTNWRWSFRSVYSAICSTFLNKTTSWYAASERPARRFSPRITSSSRHPVHHRTGRAPPRSKRGPGSDQPGDRGA